MISPVLPFAASNYKKEIFGSANTMKPHYFMLGLGGGSGSGGFLYFCCRVAIPFLMKGIATRQQK